jgi:NADH dehydrogenase [ubiquinone] 1 alpha subcomplex assembly factor 5
MLGADTLQELRISYTLAENERYGGVSQHISPFASITEIGNLITRLNYTLPTVFSQRKYSHS